MMRVFLNHQLRNCDRPYERDPEAQYRNIPSQRKYRRRNEHSVDHYDKTGQKQDSRHGDERDHNIRSFAREKFLPVAGLTVHQIIADINTCRRRRAQKHIKPNGRQRHLRTFQQFRPLIQFRREAVKKSAAQNKPTAPKRDCLQNETNSYRTDSR